MSEGAALLAELWHPPPAMRVRRWLWMAVPLLALLELGAHFFFASRAPRVEQWRELRSTVAELRRHDELVVVAPHWAEPLARHAFGDQLMPLAHVARADESRFRRAIEIGILGERAPELRGWREVDARARGPFRLSVLENPAPAVPRFDFVAALGPERASVHVEHAAGAVETVGRRSCNWSARARVQTGGLHGHVAFPRQRFECASNEFFVGVTVIDDQSYRPRRCIWAHPMSEGPLVVTYRDVPLGDVVRGHAGLSWFIHRDGGRAPVELEVRVAGRVIGRHVHRDEQGWTPFSFRVGAQASATSDVELVIRSADVRDRHFCFEADTR